MRSKKLKIDAEYFFNDQCISIGIKMILFSFLFNGSDRIHTGMCMRSIIREKKKRENE